MIRSALKKLGIIEKGITKYQINQMLTALESLTPESLTYCSSTEGSTMISSSSDPSDDAQDAKSS